MQIKSFIIIDGKAYEIVEIENGKGYDPDSGDGHIYYKIKEDG